MNLRKFQAGTGKFEAHKIAQVAELIDKAEGPVSPNSIAAQTDLSARKVTTVLNRLQETGAVEADQDGTLRLTENVDVHEAAERAIEIQDRLKLSGAGASSRCSNTRKFPPAGANICSGILETTSRGLVGIVITTMELPEIFRSVGSVLVVRLRDE